MNRGIQLKQLRASDLGHVGIPYYLLGNPPTAIDPTSIDDETFADDEPNVTSLLACADGDPTDPLPDPLTLTREIRRGLEQALALLTQALPPDCRSVPRRDD